MPTRALLRTTTFGLSALYGLIFAVALVALLGLVYLRSAVYLTRRVDGILATESAGLAGSSPSTLAPRIDEALSLDGRRLNLFALFDPAGRRIAGNLDAVPPGLKPDGGPLEIAPTPSFAAPARLIARRLASGDLLVVGRDVDQLQEMRSILASALIGSGLAVIAAGLACGVAFSLSPLHRLRVLQDACADIAGGDLGRRLPTSEHHDELDMLAATVNFTMGEIERLMSEVRSTTDTIAHDLRTPLTRARTQLHRLQQAPGETGAEVARIVAELDVVLERFRALLRLSQLEAGERRGGFTATDLAQVVADVADLYQPLAEANGVGLRAEPGPSATVDADPKLLFEAVSNLVDNAIKFAGEGGAVSLRVEAAGPGLVVQDNGPGIPAAEKSAVLRRFYRGERDRLSPGSGLGLSIAAAIVRLHGFALELGDADPGLRAAIVCRRTSVSY